MQIMLLHGESKVFTIVFINLGDLHAIREINKIVYDKEAAKKVFEVLAPRYKYFFCFIYCLENVLVVIQEFYDVDTE